jgi:hypothetical protein
MFLPVLANSVSNLFLAMMLIPLNCELRMRRGSHHIYYLAPKIRTELKKEVDSHGYNPIEK